GSGAAESRGWFEQGLDLVFEPADRAVEALDLLEQLLGGVRRARGQEKTLAQEGAAPYAEEIADLQVVEGGLRQGGVNAILESRALPDEYHPRRGKSRWSRSAPGGIQTVGSVPFRWSWLSPRTSSRSVLLILPSSVWPCGRARVWGRRRRPRSRRRSNTNCRRSRPPPGSPAHSGRETAGTLRAHVRSAVHGRDGHPAGPPTPARSACGHRTRHIPCAAPPSRPAAAECCPTHTVTSPRAEAQRFHPIKGRRFKS